MATKEHKEGKDGNDRITRGQNDPLVFVPIRQIRVSVGGSASLEIDLEADGQHTLPRQLVV
jgi:hypothetical protein